MKKIALIFCLALVALPYSHVLAGPGFGSGINDAGGAGGGAGGAGGGAGAPLDGGMSILLLAGIGYGIKKFTGSNK